MGIHRVQYAENYSSFHEGFKACEAPHARRGLDTGDARVLYSWGYIVFNTQKTIRVFPSRISGLWPRRGLDTGDARVLYSWGYIVFNTQKTIRVFPSRISSPTPSAGVVTTQTDLYRSRIRTNDSYTTHRYQ
jgi:hypothetical protein